MDRGTIAGVDVPRIRFASTARGKIAFQALGGAEASFVLVPPLAQHIEMMWDTEIASQLELSSRTVENHLAHVYAKLGVRSRTELALLNEA